MADLHKENQLLQEQVRALVQQLQERNAPQDSQEISRNDQTRNDQSSFFSAFKNSATQSKLHRDTSKRDLSEMAATIKKLHDEKEQLRLMLSKQTEAFNQKLKIREDELISKERMIRTLQNEFKELMLENSALKSSKQQLQQQQQQQQQQSTLPEESVKAQSTVPTQNELQLFKVLKVGLLNVQCLFIIRKNIYDQPLIEWETAQHDRAFILLSDIKDLSPDKYKEHQFSISYKNQTDTFISQDARNICRNLKTLLMQSYTPRKSEIVNPNNGGGLIKSLSQLFTK